MKRNIWGCLWVLAGSITSAEFCARAQSPHPPALARPGDNDPSLSPCLDAARMSLTASPSIVQFGQSSTLTWSVTLPASCTGVRVTLNGQTVGRSGTRGVTPSRNSTFTMFVSQTWQGTYQEISTRTQLQVRYPSRVIIDQNTADPVHVLIGALTDSANPVQTVELCNVDLDFTGRSGLVVDANRSLIASPACARGPRSLGPRIFVRDKRDEHTALFVIRDSNVRFSGFRLEGPTSGIGSDDNNLEVGIQVFPFDYPGLVHDIEISNMEISQWSGAGIAVGDNTATAEHGRLTSRNVSGVHVRNNFLHHNRHSDGNGYGVSVRGGGYALIEQNVFEQNRHAIAGISSDGKKDYSGYTAQDNLILPGGGLNCNFLTCWHTHQIDMHGDQSTFLGGDWCCGTAGETIIIQRNTILYTGDYYADGVWGNGLAIKIRGNPADKAIVDGNVFKHKNRNDAIAQNGNPDFGNNITNPIDVRPNNVFGVDPSIQLGKCDFAGDGLQDQFMATGVTWWAKSPTTLQWRYLNTMPQRLRELQLGKFDNDAVCDVAPAPPPNPARPPLDYSKSGTGPWMPLLTVGNRL